MFTGLIAATGTLLTAATEPAPRITVALPQELAKGLSDGDSIAVNGCCVTALQISGDRFSADLAAETLARTTLGRLPVGAIVNLELPTATGAPLGGHIVQGHVDGVGRVLALEEKSGGDWDLRVHIPAKLADALLPQGSVALNGISLTVAEMQPHPEGLEVRIAVIPHTYRVTNLHTLRSGGEVNIETDVLAKYAARRAYSAPPKITLASLVANGY